MEGISIKPTTSDPSKLSCLSYKYIFEQLMIARESDLEFWIPVVRDLAKAFQGWRNFRKMSFQITSTYDIQGDFTEDFKITASTLINNKDFKDLLPRLMIKFANVYERKLTVPRLLEFLFQERIYFIKCLSTIFLNCVRDTSEEYGESDTESSEEEDEGEDDEEESEDKSMKKRRRNKKGKLSWEGLCSELIRGKIGHFLRRLIFETRSRVRIPIHHTGQTHSEREQKKIDFFFMYQKNHMEEIGEELDLLFMMIYSRQMRVGFENNFQQWVSVLARGTDDPRKKKKKEQQQQQQQKSQIPPLGFGKAYMDKLKNFPIRGEALRINALCVMNFLLMLQVMDVKVLDRPDDFEEKDKKRFDEIKSHVLRIDYLIDNARGKKANIGVICLSWATFLRKNWNKTLAKIFNNGEETIKKHFQKGMEMNGILYLRTLFGRKEQYNYPFYGHEQNLECYRTVVSNFLVSLLFTMGDLPSLPYRFIYDIASVQVSLLSPFSNVTHMENFFLKDYYQDFIDLDEENDAPLVIHPYTQLFHVMKTYLPSKLELLTYFGALVFDPGSAFTICSYLDRVKHFTLDFEKDEFDRVLRKERVSPSREVQTMVPTLMDELPADKVLERFPEYRMLESYRDAWTGVTIPKNTRFIILNEHDGVVLLGFHKIPQEEELAGRRNRKRKNISSNNNSEEDDDDDDDEISLIRVLVRIFMNMKYRLMHDYEISRRYNYLFTFFARILKHGSHHLLRYLDYQLFRLGNPSVKKHQMPQVHGSGLLFLQNLQEILGLSIDRLGSRGGGVVSVGGNVRYEDRKILSLISVITGIWKCLNGFALKKPKEVMMMVMKYLSSFDQVVEIEGITGLYACVIELLEILKTLTDKHSVNLRQDVFFLVEWMAGNVFVGHMSWKYQGFTHRWLISLRCLEIFNRLVKYYSAMEVECLIETLFFDPNNQCGQSLFLLLGQCRQWYKEITKKKRGDDVQVVVKLIDECFKFVESLLRFKNEKGFLGRAIRLALEQLIGREQKPIIRILFQYTLEMFPTDIRKRACDVMRFIIEMNRPPSIVASLGSKGLLYVGKQLHYIQTEMEVTDLKVSLVRLITAAILARQGLGQMYLHYDPAQFYYAEIEKRATGILSSSEPLLNTYIKKKELTKGGYPSILIDILETFHSNEGELIQACLESIEAIFTSSSMAIRKIIRTNPKFWRIVFEMFESLSNEKKQRNKQHLHVIKSIKNILDIMTIDLYFGKLMNTYVDDPSVFKTFYLEFNRNPGVFLAVLGRSVEKLKSDLDECCVNLVVLRRHVEKYNFKYKKKRLNIEEFKSEHLEKVYDLDRLKRWKLRVLARKEQENRSKQESDPVQKDIKLYLNTTRPEYDAIAEEEREILELAELMNEKYLLMNSYIKMLESFSSMFTVFVIPLQDNNKNAVLISFPQIRRFLDILIFKGLEFYSKKSELPGEILSIQRLFHLRCAKMILCVLKGIAQLIGVQVVNDRLEMIQKGAPLGKRSIYVTIKHVEFLAYCLEREIGLRNDEIVLAILTDFLFMFMKIEKAYMSMDFSQVAMILNPLLLVVLEKYTIHGENIERVSRQQDVIEMNQSGYEKDNSRKNVGRRVLAFKDRKRAERMSKQRVHTGFHSDKTIDELFRNNYSKFDKSGNNKCKDEETDENDDEEEGEEGEEGYSFESKHKEETRTYHIITIALQLLSISETFTSEQVKRIIMLMKRETGVCDSNPTYQPNSEYIENLLSILVSIVTKSLIIKNEKILNLDDEKLKKKRNRKKKEDLVSAFAFPEMKPQSMLLLPAYPIVQNDMIDATLRVISRVFPVWNYLPFKTSSFLSHYRSTIKHQSPKLYLNDHPTSLMELSRHEEYFLSSKGRRQRLNFPLLFRLFQGTIHAHKINWSRGYERRFAASYPSWHSLWMKCLQLMMSLLIHFPDDQSVRKRIVRTIQMNSDRFIYSLVLKSSSDPYENITSQYGRDEEEQRRRGGSASSNSPSSTTSSSASSGGGKYEPRKTRELRHVVDEYLAFTMSELKEAKLVSSMLSFLTKELCERENENLLLGMMEGFSHATEMLNRGVEAVVKPFTKRERKIYEKSFQLRSYLMNEDDKKRKEMKRKRNKRIMKDEEEEEEDEEIERRLLGGPMDQEGEDDDEDGEGQGKGKNTTILKRSFQLLEKSNRITWASRAHFLLFDILKFNLRVYFRILKIEQMSQGSNKRVEVLRKHDISSKNFFYILELMKVCVNLISKVAREMHRSATSTGGSGVADLEKSMTAEDEGESVKNLFEMRDKEFVEINRLQLIIQAGGLIEYGVKACNLHIECKFEPGVASRIHHHRTPEELKDKLRGNFRNVVKLVRQMYQHLEHYKKVFKKKSCRDVFSKMVKEKTEWIYGIMDQKFKQVKTGELYQRKYMGDSSSGGGLFD